MHVRQWNLCFSLKLLFKNNRLLALHDVLRFSSKRPRSSSAEHTFACCKGCRDTEHLTSDPKTTWEEHLLSCQNCAISASLVVFFDIPIFTELLISMERYFSFPFPWDSHGNPISMHISSVKRSWVLLVVKLIRVAAWSIKPLTDSFIKYWSSWEVQPPINLFRQYLFIHCYSYTQCKRARQCVYVNNNNV